MRVIEMPWDGGDCRKDLPGYRRWGAINTGGVFGMGTPSNWWEEDFDMTNYINLRKGSGSDIARTKGGGGSGQKRCPWGATSKISKKLSGYFLARAPYLGG